MPGSRVQYIALGAFLATMLVAIGVVIQRSDDASSGRVEAQAVAAGDSSGISATGFALVTNGNAGSFVVNMNFEDHSDDDAGLQTALNGVQARIETVSAAARAAGVPADKISTNYWNLYPAAPPNYPIGKDGYPAPMATPDAGTPGNSGYVVSTNVSIEVTSLDGIVSLTRAAMAAGAIGVNTSQGGKQGPAPLASPPDAAALANGIDTATKQAMSLAQAAGKSANAKLGTLRAVNVEAPQPDYSSPYGGMNWSVRVTVTYDTAR